jgi:hypothetical protein
MAKLDYFNKAAVEGIDELSEEDLDQSAGGAIVYNNGVYDLVQGNTLIGSFYNYDDAYITALQYGYGTAYFASKADYLGSLYPERRRGEVIRRYLSAEPQVVPNYQPASPWN